MMLDYSEISAKKYRILGHQQDYSISKISFRQQVNLLVDP